MSNLVRRAPWVIVAVLAVLVPIAAIGGPLAGAAQVSLLLLGVGLAVWFTARVLQRLLFRVGRRLAFSYFLIGVLPIPMVLILGVMTLALLGGFFVGDLFRTAVETEYAELRHAAENRQVEFAASRAVPPSDGERRYGYYRRGVRIAGDPMLPRRWPAWIDQYSQQTNEGRPSFVALKDGSPALAAASRRGDVGVIAVYSDSISRRLSETSGVWTALLRADDPDKPSVVKIDIYGKTFAFRPFSSSSARAPERTEFFGSDAGGAFWTRPIVFWVELSGPLLSLDSGDEVAPYVAAELNATPVSLYRRLVSGSTELSTVAIGIFASVVALLSAIYAIAVGMALFIIYALSRAVNSLTTATDAVRAGDFSARIPVHRRDQIGELQNSFNQMSSSLEELVATAAQNEILEKELSIAREVQQSLIPSDLPKSEEVEFATLFEPSAAIGGDYFDVLPLSDERLAVVVADVSGHGLPTGLRMAMLKAALGILVEDGKSPSEVFARLHEIVRGENAAGARYFVTATICLIDLSTGRAEVTNAGHPPTYLVRAGTAREVVLHGSPLGTLGKDYGREALELEPGVFVVWLSDGLIERLDSAGDPFGYDRLREALSVETTSASALRDELVGAIEEYAGSVPAGDDCTLVVMHYSPIASAGSRPNLA